MRALVLAAVASLVYGAPAQAQRLAGVRPDVASDEGGLWSESDKAESVARQSAELDRDPALTAYVGEVACKVARDHCADIRVYVMDRPIFNATMAPNGYTEVWSGSLLRVSDEAELAFILGHEISHFDRNHSVLSWRRKKSTSNAIMVLSAGVAVVGVAAASGAATYDGASSIMDATRGLINVVYLTGMASLFSYDRENELEADRLGLQRAAQAGYEPVAATAVWRAQMEETAASEFKRVRNSGARTNIFASHPVDAERMAALQDDLKALPATGEVGLARYRAAIRPHLDAWLRDDLRRRDFGQTLHLIGRLAADGEDLGVLNFYRGEAYRQRRGEGDLAQARDAYLAAVAYPDAPVAVWRELGDLRRKESDTAGAKAAYETYLAKAPTAEDGWIVQDSLNSLKSGN